MHMTERLTPEKSPWGWKALFIFCILGGIFMFIFWLAVTNEPDYMPSQQQKQNTQQHAFKNAPAMSQEALAKAQAVFRILSLKFIKIFLKYLSCLY